MVIDYNKSYRQVLHDVDKVLLGQGVLIQLVLLGLEVLWVRFSATKHLGKYFNANMHVYWHHKPVREADMREKCSFFF